MATTYSVTPSPSTVTEGNQVTFTVTRSGDKPVETVYFSTRSDGTATYGEGDFTTTSGGQPLNIPISFGSGVTSQTVTLNIASDGQSDSGEQFRTIVQRNSSDNASTFLAQSSYVTINDAVATTYSLTPASTTVGENVGNVTFTITRSGSFPAETLYASTLYDTAASSGDYTGIVDQAISFSSGQTSATFSVHVNDDGAVESTEHFRVMIARATGQGSAQAIDISDINITDNDAVATTYNLTPASTTVGENVGNVTFTITRSGSFPPETLYASTLYDTAASSGDYTGIVDQAISFSSGQTSATFSVHVNDDSAVESTEHFRVMIARATGQGSAQAIDISDINITDNDAVQAGDTIANDTGTTATLSAGQTVSGVIDQDDVDGNFIDTDYYRVTLTGGQRYTFGANANVNAGDALDQVFVRLRGSDGNALSPDIYSEGATPSFTFDVPGSGSQTYYVAISAGGNDAWWDKTGDFTLSLVQSGTAPVVNHTPYATGHDRTEATGTPIPLTELFTFGDPDGPSDIVSFAVQDRTNGGGNLTYDGQQMASNTVYERSIAEIGKWAFVVGDSEPDTIGFNAVDSDGLYNKSALSAVTSISQSNHDRSSLDSFLHAGGKFAALAEFSIAAYPNASIAAKDIENHGWNIVDFNGDYYRNGNASALVAVSEDTNSIVISFTGTDPSDINDLKDDIFMDDHYSKFDNLFEFLDLENSDYDHIYFTGHSLGAAMVQAAMIDQNRKYFEDERVEAVTFANPGYKFDVDTIPQLDNMVNISIYDDAIAKYGTDPRVAGDRYIVNQIIPSIVDAFKLHDINLYLAVTKHIDNSYWASAIEKSNTDGIDSNHSIDANLGESDTGGFYAFGPIQVEYTPLEAISIGIAHIASPVAELIVTGYTVIKSINEGADRFVVEAPNLVETTLRAGAGQAADQGKVVLSAVTDGGEYLLNKADDFTELSLNAGKAALRAILSPFSGTDIGQHTIYFNGNIGNDVLEGGAADRRIVAEGGSGDDNFTGGLSEDELHGGIGNDALDGGSGNDVLDGGAGTNTLDGGSGLDVATFAFASGSASIVHNANGSWTISNGSDTTDTLTNVEIARFTDKDKSIRQAPTTDLDGSNVSDILWRSSSTGQVGSWLMTNNRYSSFSTIGKPSLDWNATGIGDFNGDGTSDILWRSSTTGQVGSWLMTNNRYSSFSSIGKPTLDWAAAGIGDFNGDGTSDILWRSNTTGEVGSWLMTDNRSSFSSIGKPTLAWDVAGVGDFNGDGTSDVLWRNSTTGEAGSWLMTNNRSSFSSIGRPSLAWDAAGIGDFNGDGTSDILWRNSTTGEVGSWLMTNNRYSSFSPIGKPSLAWDVAGIGDFNGDGTSDILWRNSTTGEVGSWLMTNNRYSSFSSIGKPSLDWGVVSA